MIVSNWDWSLLDIPNDMGECASPAVLDRPHERVSELLGPDGEPLLVAYPRRAIGFDLRPQKRGGNDA